jgi:hypothetical protein
MLLYQFYRLILNNISLFAILTKSYSEVMKKKSENKKFITRQVEKTRNSKIHFIDIGKFN